MRRPSHMTAHDPNLTRDYAMKTILPLPLLILLLVNAAPTAPPPTQQQRDFVMRPAAKFTDDDATPQIIGGSKAAIADWPATFVFLDPNGGGCTSTAIGTRVIITAAHCIKDNATGVVEIDGTPISASCSHHPDYHDNVLQTDQDWEKKVSPDFSLCALTSDLTVKDFETIGSKKDSPVKGSTIRLLGFGCNKTGGTDGGFGVLYEGDAGVTKIPEPPSYYITTLGGAAVCFGDSGGGAYLYLNQAHTRRVMVGVNSRGDISTTSLLSATTTPGFSTWASSWAAKNHVKICGLHSDAKGCRTN